MSNVIRTTDLDKAVRIFEDNLEDSISERGRKIVVSRYRVAARKHLSCDYLSAPVAEDAKSCVPYVEFTNISPQGDECERFHHEFLVSYFDNDGGLRDTFDAAEALGYDKFVRAMLNGSAKERQAEIRKAKQAAGEPIDDQ